MYKSELCDRLETLVELWHWVETNFKIQSFLEVKVSVFEKFMMSNQSGIVFWQECEMEMEMKMQIAI